jgi:hypothetical protein
VPIPLKDTEKAFPSDVIALFESQWLSEQGVSFTGVLAKVDFHYVSVVLIGSGFVFYARSLLTIKV